MSYPGVLKDLLINGTSYRYHALPELSGLGFGSIDRLPFSIRILVENLLRRHDGVIVSDQDLAAIADWRKTYRQPVEIAYHPARVLMQDFTGFEPKMWGPSIIGFGSYHYKSDRSKQEGDWPLTGFSPRKQYIAVYIMSGVNKYPDLLSNLGKYKISSGSCIYINKIEDINPEILKEIISASVSDMKKIYNVD